MLRKNTIHLFAAISTVLLIGSASTALAYFDSVTANTWRAMSDTTIRGFSWDAISAVCPVDGITPCADGSATASTADDGIFTGWIWGTRDEVNILFKDVTGLGAALNDYTESNQVYPLTWGTTAISALGAIVQEADFLHTRSTTEGWTSTLQPGDPAQAFLGTLQICDGTANASRASCVGGGIDALQSVDVSAQQPPNFSFTTRSAWLFQPSAIPEPATLLLISAGLAGLAALRRRP